MLFIECCFGSQRNVDLGEYYGKYNGLYLFGDKVYCFEIDLRHFMATSELLMCIMRSVNFPDIVNAVIFLSSSGFPVTLREVVSFGGGGR